MTALASHGLLKPRPQPHTIILARGEKVRHWQVRTGVLAAGLAGLATALAGCVGAAILFFVSDDVASAFQSREERTVAAYEQRISSLRQQLDRMTSRQFTDRELVREQVELLIGRHEELTSRFDRLEPLLNEARASGLLPAEVPRPSARPDRSAPATDATHSAAASAFAPATPPSALERFDQFGLKGASLGRVVDPITGEANLPGLTDVDFAAIARDLIPSLSWSIKQVHEMQSSEIGHLTQGARTRISAIETVLNEAGIALPAEVTAGVGGPFVAAPTAGSEDDLTALSDALDQLQRLNAATERLPFGQPLVGGERSSPFGVRTDPFLKRKALHTGLDFAARAGTQVVATAAGTVIRAGYNGGYGKMVEIDHGNGFVTRYAHLASIQARLGDKVDLAAPVGAVGSTGRSTGPHLHYEVRRGGGAVDPSRFLKTGERLRALN